MKTARNFIALSCLLILAACRPAPSAEEVKRVVAAHFEARGYPALEISVKNISALATSEKTYMGVPAFVVELDRLVLQVDGQERVFRGVRLMLKDVNSPEHHYTVSDISGVPLP
jgi:hypothetical protein